VEENKNIKIADAITKLDFISGSTADWQEVTTYPLLQHIEDNLEEIHNYSY
jgi:hypothetical protein